jgi:biotin synthase
VQQVIKNAIAGTGCSRAEARQLIALNEADLFRGATDIREAHFGNRIQLCSIINAKSGRCDMDCRFCSQSSHNSTRINAYPFLDAQPLENRIHEIIGAQDRHCGVVTSGGKLSDDEIERFAATVRNIGKGGPVPVCASTGRLTGANLEALKKSGVTRFHHNLESSEAYYHNICTTQDWRQRYDTVKAAQAAGLAVCCGGLFGLGESWDDRIDLAMTLRELGVNSVPINFLYSHEGTPLADRPPLDAAEALRIIAIYRFILPAATLRICGGRTHVLGEQQARLFAAGANGLMTGNYLTVVGSQYETDRAMLDQLGLQIQTN